MTTDLWMLVWSAVLCLVTPYAGVTVLLSMPGGPAWGFGNRDSDFAVPFACLVLVAHVSGKANATTAFASQLFLASRVLYTLVYMAGIPYLRTIVFSGGVLACFLILMQLL
jgi:uncharacterized MAPEG superfamily protein